MSRFVILCRVLLISFVASSFLAESAWATVREKNFRLGRESAEKEYLLRNQDLLLETESKISKKDAEIDSLNQQLEDLKRQNEGLEAEKNQIADELDREKNQNQQTSLSVGQLKQEISVFQHQEAELSEKLRKLESDLNKTQKEKELSIQEKQALAEKIQEEERIREEVRKTLDTSQIQLAELQKKLEQSDINIQELERLKNEKDDLSSENTKRQKYIAKCQKLTVKVSKSMGTNITSPLSLLTHLSKLKPDESSALFQSGARLSFSLGNSDSVPAERAVSVPRGFKKKKKKNEGSADEQFSRSDGIVNGNGENVLGDISVFQDRVNRGHQSQTLGALLSPTRNMGPRPVVVGQVRAFGAPVPINVQQEMAEKNHPKKSESIDQDNDLNSDQIVTFLNGNSAPQDDDRQPQSPLRQYQMLSIPKVVHDDGGEDFSSSQDHDSVFNDEDQMLSLSSCDVQKTESNDIVQTKQNTLSFIFGIVTAVQDSEFMKLGGLGWVRSKYLDCLSAVLPEPIYDGLLYHAERMNRFSRSHMMVFGTPFPVPFQNRYGMYQYSKTLNWDKFNEFSSNNRQTFIKKEEVVRTRLSQNDAYGEPWIDDWQ